MQVLLLIAGLILLLVSPPLFAAAATVGWILLGVFAAITVFQLVVFVAAAWKIKKEHSQFGRRF